MYKNYIYDDCLTLSLRRSVQRQQKIMTRRGRLKDAIKMIARCFKERINKQTKKKRLNDVIIHFMLACLQT